MDELLDKYITTLKKSSQILRGKFINCGNGPKLDLKFSQLKAISTFNEERSFTLKELAGNGNIKLSNMSRMVNDLISEGIAERKNSEIDRRNVFVCLTPKGKEIRKAFLENKRRSALSILSSLTEENKSELLSSLDKACRILEDTIQNDESLSLG